MLAFGTTDGSDVVLHFCKQHYYYYILLSVSTSFILRNKLVTERMISSCNDASYLILLSTTKRDTNAGWNYRALCYCFRIVKPYLCTLSRENEKGTLTQTMSMKLIIELNFGCDYFRDDNVWHKVSVQICLNNKRSRVDR